MNALQPCAGTPRSLAAAFVTALLTASPFAAASLAACASPQQATQRTNDPWVHVTPALGAFTIAEGVVVEVAGSGTLEFRDGRRTIVVPRGLSPRGADEEAIPAGPFGGGRIRLVDDAGHAVWTLRPVQGLPAVPGTRIRDPRGSGAASVASADPIVFFIRVAEDGSTEFLHPEAPRPVAAGLGNMLDRYSGYGFSGVVAISEGDAPPIVVAAGRRAGPGSAPMDPTTVFEIGSLTKQMTAAAVLELADRGLLSTDAPLSRWYPDLPPPLRAITIHQLLIHTSGLPEDVDVPVDDPAAVWPALSDADLEFDPGTGWSYSNAGYVALAAIAEESAPGGYRALVNELIRRSGVRDIGFPEEREDWKERFATGGSGPLGTGRIEDRWAVRSRGWDERLGASGLVATVPALIEWFRALHDGRVLSAEATGRMFADHPPDIAYGWFYLRDGQGAARIAHGGDTEGFQTYLVHDPAEDRVVALGVNDRRGWRGPILRGVDALLGGGALHDLPPAVGRSSGASGDLGSLGGLVGAYRLADGSLIDVDTVPGRLRISATGQQAIAMLAGADSALSDTLAQRSRDAEEFLSILLRNDAAAVEAMLPSPDRADSFWEVWNHLGADHPGAPEAFEVVGTIPDRAGRSVTFVEVRFATGTEVLRLVWRPELDGWGTGGGLPSRDFWPVGDDGLVSYDPTRTGLVQLLVGRSGQGPVIYDAAGRRAERR